MRDITCDVCGKKYRMDETKMKGARAKVKCKACHHIMLVTKPQPEVTPQPSPFNEIYQPSPANGMPEPTTSQPPQDLSRVTKRPNGPSEDKPDEPQKGVSPLLNGQKIRFGLFAKIIIVMLIVSLLPFAIFYGGVLVLQQQGREVLAAFYRVQQFALILLGGTILLVSMIAWFSARAIVTPIMKLTDAAERMSLGDLNVKIDIRSKDEIGLLAHAIGRMQTSLRLAMNRLRRSR